MFNSISNNFGAGQITFKDYQAPNYVVLNAKVTFDPTNPAYQACQQLEITVPDLTIDRSTIGGVFVRFIETQTYSWGDSIYDGGTVLKSWIKDKNTIVVEKQPWFDQNGPLILYFVTMYAQLNQGANTIKGTKQRLTVTTEGWNGTKITNDAGILSDVGRTAAGTHFNGLLNDMTAILTLRVGDIEGVVRRTVLDSKIDKFQILLLRKMVLQVAMQGTAAIGVLIGLATMQDELVEDTGIVVGIVEV